jgi:hypothetical protein
MPYDKRRRMNQPQWGFHTDFYPHDFMKFAVSFESMYEFITGFE